MRIFGRTCGWIMAIILIVQAISAFCGHPFDSAAIGLEFVVIAAWCAVDATVYFRKPKLPYLRVKFRHDDAPADEFVVRLDRTVTFEEPLQKPIRSLDIVYFESNKDEVSNERKN